MTGAKAQEDEDPDEDEADDRARVLEEPRPGFGEQPAARRVQQELTALELGDRHRWTAPDPRVEEPVREVDEEVDEHEDEGNGEGILLQNRVVAI